MKKKQTYIVFGGAGYLGQFLIQFLNSNLNGEKVYVVTRNRSKEFMFREPNVEMCYNLDEIKNQEIKIVNLAFSLEDTFEETKQANKILLRKIQTLISNNSVVNIVHVSTIILSLNKRKFDSINVKKESTYYYAKSYFEKQLKLISDKTKTPIYVVRSGNIIGPGSPWINTIYNSLLYKLPITGSKSYYPSNSTFVGNLSKVIYLFSNKEYVAGQYFNIFNFAEFGNVCWKEIINSINVFDNINPVNWHVNSFSNVNKSLIKEVKYVFKKTIKSLIPQIYKLPKLNVLTVKILGFLRLKNTKGKMKIKLSQKSNKNEYLANTMEYDKIFVFLNEEKMTTENIPTEFLNQLDYDFDMAMESIKSWCYFSGYNTCFEKR